MSHDQNPGFARLVSGFDQARSSNGQNGFPFGFPAPTKGTPSLLVASRVNCAAMGHLPPKLFLGFVSRIGIGTGATNLGSAVSFWLPFKPIKQKG